MSDDAVARAREALDAGVAWRARDLLAAHVETERDPEALALLGEVLHGMGDLPRAGAAWFAAGTTGEAADAAVAAWREQTGDDFAAMWTSLPASAREAPRSARVEALRAKALAVAPEVVRPGDAPTGGSTASAGSDDDAEGGGGLDAAQVIGWVLAALFCAAAVVGVVTVLGWLFPG